MDTGSTIAGGHGKNRGREAATHRIQNLSDVDLE